MSKPPSGVEHSDGSPANGSRRVSLAGREDGGRDVAWTIKPEDIAKERQRGRLRDK